MLLFYLSCDVQENKSDKSFEVHSIGISPKGSPVKKPRPDLGPKPLLESSAIEADGDASKLDEEGTTV
jgi:hypothetical protein